ncbi:MAG: hypothetical protein HYY24_05555 [Verrucomicrobia bacterium]|nr:hypothetical protein [Verrucomicrobiota bacterium]
MKRTGKSARINFTLLTGLLLLAGVVFLVGCASTGGGSDHSSHQHSHH